jgi:hypothetical protein
VQQCAPRSAVFVLWVAVLFFFVASPSRAQISPGPLSKAHASLNGTTQCNSCHVFGASTPTFKCLDCHKEVAEALANKHGYHFRLQMQNPNGKECVRCHLEHNGENFNLMHWEPSEKNFNHKLTGYPIEGKHAAVPCAQCHTPATMLPAIKPLIKYKDPAKSFFGQSPNCTPCHADPHKGQLGNDCAKCHNVESWQGAKEFDHSKTKYPLSGLHAKVACESCHKPDTPGGPVRYQGLKFETCASCHSDPHRGEFKKSCEACHTTGGWKNLLQGFDFDHSKTKYPLLGKHAQLACSACHVRDDFKKEIAFAACKDCHSPDPHKGQFVGRPQKGECAECHTVEGWKPSLFSVKEHDMTEYPLKGKHAQVQCSLCHVPEGKDALYRVKFAACSDCHKDAHDNQFAAAPFNNGCESCHSVADWHRASYSITKHASSRFPLLGAHAAVPCSNCHKIGMAGRTDKILPFSFNDRTCTACHTDPHKGEFASQMARTRGDGTVFGCEACHNVKSWGEISGFDHSKTSYPLLGAHRTVACNDCHRPSSNPQSRFSGTPTQCESCHQDVHDGQFLAQHNQTHCADCHIPQRWAPSTFDHETKTHFSLAGGHVNVPCAKCHTQTRTTGSKEVIVYKNAPSKCADCHGNSLDKQKS